jgi:cell wall-associated NlpC family hydrolase
VRRADGPLGAHRSHACLGGDDGVDRRSRNGLGGAGDDGVEVGKERAGRAHDVGRQAHRRDHGERLLEGEGAGGRRTDGPLDRRPVDDRQGAVRGEQAAQLGEQYNGAVIALQKAQDDVAAAEQQLAATQQQLAAKRSTVSEFALKAYLYADQTGSLTGLLSGTSLAEGAVQRTAYAQLALGANLDDASQLKAMTQDLEVQKQQLQRKRDKAAKATDAVASAKQAALDMQARQRDTLTQVQGDLAVLVQQEQQRRAAEAQSAARAAQAAAEQAAQAALTARHTPSTRTTGGTTGATGTPTAPSAGGRGTGQGGGSTGSAPAPAPKPVYNIPPTSPGAAIAVRAALSQLGVPYSFATANPGVSFDCSGLTMWAWAQAGVSMAHYSYDQARESLPSLRARSSPATSCSRPASATSACTSATACT